MDRKRKSSVTNGHDRKQTKKKPKPSIGVQNGQDITIPVDQFCNQKFGSAHVYQEGTDIYDVMLNQTNVQHNNNKYYVIQLIEDNARPHYYVWFRWGRVGTSGQNKLTDFGTNLSEAKTCFMQKFSDKTHNDWAERHRFKKVDGKYDLVKIDYTHLVKSTKECNERVVSVECTLPEPIQILLKLICDLKVMEDAVNSLQYDTKRAPLGKLTKEQVKAGYKALDKISSCLAALNATKKESSGRGRSGRVSDSKSDVRKHEQALLMACNEFYTRIPHDFGMRIPPLIRTPAEVKEKIELLEALDDIRFAMDMMKEEACPVEHVLDSQYRKLDCELVHLVQSDPTYQLLSDYLMTNRGPTHSWYTLELLDVFSCSKPKESEQFKDCGNRLLLWHGSRLSNWVGILGRGLQVAPPEAPMTGYMFGKGIYFADCSTKSANYAYPTANKNVGLVALCEVSLGTPQVHYQACYTANQLPDGYHSVKGAGKLIPPESSWKALPDGVNVPVGSLVPCDEAVAKSATLQFNEYVVYDPNQVRLRYVLKVKFNFT